MFVYCDNRNGENPATPFFSVETYFRKTSRAAARHVPRARFKMSGHQVDPNRKPIVLYVKKTSGKYNLSSKIEVED